MTKASTALHNAVRRLLRPLVQLMINGEMTFPSFVDLAREVYVDVAVDDFGVGGQPGTDSRIAILTGIHRKAVRSLASRDRTLPGPPPTLALGAKVIAVWCSTPEYLEADGRPRPLPRSAAEGKPSLERLVASLSKDVRPRTILDEWLRLGVVELEGDMVRLRTAGFVPSRGYEEKAYYFGRNLRDHIAAGAHNLTGQEPPLFDRSVYYDRLSSQSIDELRRFCHDKGMDLLLEINHQARALADRDRAAGQPQGRITFGAYFYAEEKIDLAQEVTDDNAERGK